MIRRALLFRFALASAAAMHGASAFAATQNASVSASVVKPLALSRLQDLDLGTIVLGPGTWSGVAVSLSRQGVRTCPGPNLTCTGATSVARYQVSGTNRQVVTIAAPNVTLVNQDDPTKTLIMVVDGPGQVTLPNSGNPGLEFDLGGRVTVSSATASGLYTGTFNVSVDYP